MPDRILKINELLRKEIGQLFLKEIDFPKNCLVTIVKVETTKDLRQAKIFLSVLPFFYSKKVLEKVSGQAGRLQFLLNKRLSFKPLPRLSFVVDETEKNAVEIDKLLDKISQGG